MNEQRITELLDKYIHHRCTDEEIGELFLAIHSHEYDHLLNNHVMFQMHTKEVAGNDMEAHSSALILHNILSGNRQKTTLFRRITKKVHYAAAAAILVIITGVIWWQVSRKDILWPKTAISQVQQKMEHHVTNRTDKAMPVQLSDGSQITLQPAATLYYAQQFNIEKREVYLEGEAFFDIAQNTRKPFVVYHSNLMTRVLGTKFYIRHNQQLKEDEVEVSAGKVEVCEHLEKDIIQKKNNGVIITPNQKVVYAEDKRLFSTVLVDTPALLTPASAGSLPYDFQAIPMSRIIQQLEKDYGIEIQTENEDITHCLFTGNISNQDMFAKLDILCKAIGSTYELKGTRILLKGKGCQ